MRKCKSTGVVILAAAIIVAASGTVARAADHGVDSMMALDPALPPIPRVPVFPPQLKGLWMQALARPDAGTRFQALEAIDAAARIGMPDVKDFLPTVLKLMRDPQQDGAIRLAAAAVTVDCNAKEAGADLLAMDRAGDLETALQVDPGLARWKTDGAAALWLERVRDPQASQQLAKSAMRSLAVIGDMDAVAALKAVVLDTGRSSGMRMTAAKSIAALGSGDAVDIAGVLLQNKDVEDRLLAATVLPAKAESTKLLVKLAQDRESAVASVAVAKAVQFSPDALYPIAAKLAAHADAVVRRNVVEVLQRHGAVEDVQALAGLLDDLAPDVRGAAREALIQLDANEKLRPAVRQAATERLNEQGHWRATEQAALVLGSVHEVAVKDKCVELLRADSADVRLGAIVALRRLNVADTLPAQLQRAEEVAAAFQQLAKSKGKPMSPENVAAINWELSQLNQNMGVEKYSAADSYLEKFVPKKSPWGGPSRYAAIWSLGLLHAGVPDAGLARQLEGRVTDESQLAPEDPEVKVMAAISLGRMGDKGAKSALKRGILDGGRVEEACEWAIAKLDGVPFAGPKPEESPAGDWFLQPAE